MGMFDFLFKKKREQERLKVEIEAERERKRLAEEQRIAEERERRLAENRRKEDERLAKQKEANSKKFQILDFFLDCSHWREQDIILQKMPLALPVKRIDVEKDDDIVEKYKVNRLPKLILVDLNGKEIKRWVGVTQSEEINNFLYNNGYVERPMQTDESLDGSDINERIKQLDLDLSGQFFVESMANDFSYVPCASLSNEFPIMEMQKQYIHYCLMAKSNLSKDIVMKGADPFMSAMKEHVKSYISSKNNRLNSAMKYLYELQDKKILIHQIGMLAMHANLKRVNDISNLTKDDFQNAMNPEHVSLALGLYVYFTILVNNKLTANDFNELFVESWISYYGECQTRIMMLKMNGNRWKNCFNGVLLDD
ncbi:hypothetical protein AAH037_03780 [Phocaeicola vulgatus]|uniref:hypothetical protein n=1 Tax=Phocaeicola vulgatus TaxID=821 RepID=UPI0039B420EB